MSPSPIPPTAAADLVIRRGGFGDTLLMLPVLAALRRASPGAALHFAGTGEFAAVLEHFGVVDRALSAESLLLWALALDDARGATARERLAAYRTIVADDPAVLAVGNGIGAVRVYSPKPARDDVPLALQLGAALGLEVDLADARLVLRRRPVASGEVALMPGSGGREKCWPCERWLELARVLAMAGTPSLVVVGPTEIERDDPRRWPWPAGTVFAAELSAVELAERLAGVRAAVGNDSGTGHLTACLLVPTVVVFMTGRPLVYAPPGAHVRVVDGVLVESVQQVLAALLAS